MLSAGGSLEQCIGSLFCWPRCVFVCLGLTDAKLKISHPLFNILIVRGEPGQNIGHCLRLEVYCGAIFTKVFK